MDIVDIRSKYGKIYVKHKVNGKTEHDIITGFQYYFYCDPLSPKDYSIVQKHASRIENHPSGYLKVFCQNDTLNKFDIENGKLDAKTIIIKYLLRKGIKTYEADFDPWKRWLLDSNHTICSNPSVVSFDIETDDSQQGIEIGRDQILSFAYHVNGKAHFFTDKDEYRLLLKLKRLFEKSDILVGWNSGNFDIPYILARFQKHL
jgi:DNA polymerase elongation subunit (family B)